MNYKIIHDEEQLKNFIEWLPELLPGETFYVSLMARSKYCKGVKHINSDKQQLRRFLSTKEFLFEKIKQMEIEEEYYFQKHNPMPQEALAVYITPNPRSFEKAAKACLIRLAELITKPYSNYNIVAEATSEVHKAVSRKIYLDIDFDNPHGDITQDYYVSNEYFLGLNRAIIEKCINKDCLTYIETRGGFHVLIELKKIALEYKNSWHQSITTLSGVDINNSKLSKCSDNMIPIPGCIQGNFVPKFIL